MAKKKRVYPLQQGLIPPSFWKAWEGMSEKARYAHLMAAINDLKTEVAILRKRIDELEDSRAELDPDWP